MRLPHPIRSLSFSLIIASMFLVACNQQKNTMFESLPASVTNVQFNNKLVDQDMFNILYYLYFYNGGGVATGDINNDGLTDIYFTANSKSNNKLYLNKGNFVFEDITTKAGVAGTADWCSGVTMADINNDGYLDIYVVASSQHHGLTGGNELFINNKNGTFTESAAIYGLNFSGYSIQSAFFDYDHDGDLDCYLLNHSQKPNSNISDTSARRKFDPLSGDRLYRNDLQQKKFVDVSAQAGIYQSSLGYGLGLAIADLNNDGWDDIYVGNDFHENDYYYVNNGNGTFTESGADHFSHYSRFSMGNDVADYNNDGQLDLVTVDMLPDKEKVLKSYGSDENPDTYKYKLMGHGYQNQYSKNCLQRNNGNGTTFSETSLQSGVSATDWSWSPLFADFDNDGNKDLFISSGIVKRPVDIDYVKFVSDLVMKMNIDKTTDFDQQAIDKMPDGASHPFFFKGDGQINFKDVSAEWGTGQMKGYYNGASYADLDNDGNLDMVINCINAPAVILKNKAPQKFMMSLTLKGNDGNTWGVGAKVWLFRKDSIQYQQMMPTRGFQSSSDLRLHFGLGDERFVDSLLVVWPNQKYQLMKNVPAKGFMTLNQAEAGGHFEYDSYFPEKQPGLQNISKQVSLPWQHQENEFYDYSRQYLIPHMLSRQGPKMAVADVNKDGLDDLFVCASSGKPAQLLVQQANGKFNPIDTELFNKAAASEKVDAVFFDANGDSYPDLYVVSGGNELDNGDPALADQFYLNDGKGHFTSMNGNIPLLLKNKSCVSVADIDHDGDMDLFVGGLTDAKIYGIAQDSYLLLNDGHAKFSLAPASIIDLKALGIITTSAFMDINKDGWLDLVVSGEWMPIKIFVNQQGQFKLAELASSTGLWQKLFPADVNGDGWVDLLAGNWGQNTKLFAGKDGPLKLYIKDFDNNGSVEQVMTYTMKGEEYTFLAKDELERSLPVLKKAYLTYSEVAGKSVQYMFYDLFKDYTALKAEVLSSSCFLNDGKGNFIRKDLSASLQMAPLFSFASFGNDQKSWIAAGNFYGTVPYEGRYDAQLPTIFNLQNINGSNKTISQLPLRGEVRDMQWLKTVSGINMLVIARNNEPLEFYKTTQ